MAKIEYNSSLLYYCEVVIQFAISRSGYIFIFLYFSEINYLRIFLSSVSFLFVFMYLSLSIMLLKFNN